MEACESKLPALVDAAAGDLKGAERRELEEHVTGCAGCRQELAELAQTEGLLHATAQRPDEFQLTGFAHRVADRAEAFRDRSARGLWWSLTRAMRFSMAFSGAAAAASLTLFVMSRQMIATPASHSQAMTQTSEPVPVALEEPDDATDVSQVLSDEKQEPEEASLDSALDALSPDELNELAQKLETSEG